MLSLTHNDCYAMLRFGFTLDLWNDLCRIYNSSHSVLTPIESSTMKKSLGLIREKLFAMGDGILTNVSARGACCVELLIGLAVRRGLGAGRYVDEQW